MASLSSLPPVGPSSQADYARTYLDLVSKTQHMPHVSEWPPKSIGNDPGVVSNIQMQWQKSGELAPYQASARCFTQEFKQHTLPAVPPKEHHVVVVGLAAGTSQHQWALSQVLPKFTYIGIDNYPTAIGIAKDIYAERPKSANHRFNFIEADGRTLQPAKKQKQADKHPTATTMPYADILLLCHQEARPGRGLEFGENMKNWAELVRAGAGICHNESVIMVTSYTRREGEFFDLMMKEVVSDVPWTRIHHAPAAEAVPANKLFPKQGYDDDHFHHGFITVYKQTASYKAA